MHRGLAFILMVTWVVACGPGKGGSETSESATEVSTGATASESGEPVTTGPTSTTAPTTGQTSEPTTEPTTGALACEDFESSADFGPSLQLTVQHMGEGPVWIGAFGCGGLPLLNLVDEVEGTLVENNGECFPTLCDEFLGQPDCQLGCNDCAPPNLLRLDPGASITINRPAIHFTPLQMTAECAPGEQCQRECLRADPLAAATYDVQVTAFRACVGDCECFDPPVDGWCRIHGVTETSEPGVFSAPLAYPGATEATVVIKSP